jgi:hypothetical protein
MANSFVVDAATRAELLTGVQEGLAKIVADAPDQTNACAKCALLLEDLITPLAEAPDRMLRASISVTSAVARQQEQLDGPQLCVGTHLNLNIGTMSYAVKKAS